MEYLVDTNLLFDYYRGNKSAKNYFDMLKEGKVKFSISVITESEIWCGIKDDVELLYWLALIDQVECINVDSKIARKAGDIFKKYGHYMGKTKKNDYRFMGDAFIAATAHVCDLKLLTANIKHFKQLESRDIIDCEAYSPDD